MKKSKTRLLALILTFVFMLTLIPALPLVQAADAYTITETYALNTTLGEYGFYGAAYNDGTIDDGLLILSKNGKWGCLDKTGKTIVAMQYDVGFSFSEGLAAVCKDGKYGYIDKTGKVVIALQYQYAFEFSDGLAAVQKDDKWNYIDKTGRVAIALKDEYNLHSFSEGLAALYSPTDGNECYIDKNGNVVFTLDRMYSPVIGFTEGLATVYGNYHYACIDNTGNVVMWGFDKPISFTNGLAYFERYGEHGFIDKTGNIAVTLPDDVYPYGGTFEEELVTVVKLKNGVFDSWGCIDKTGKFVVKLEYDYISNFHQGVAIAQKGTKLTLINTTGAVVATLPYDGVTRQNGNLAIVYKKIDNVVNYGVIEITTTGSGNTTPSDSTPSDGKLKQYDYSDFKYDFNWGKDEHNKDAVGTCNINLNIKGDIAGISAVLISAFKPNGFTQDEIKAQIDMMIPIWKKELTGGFGSFNGKVMSGFPIHDEYLGKNLTVLFFALDSKLNVLGYITVSVKIPATTVTTLAATPTASTVLINGKSVAFDAYNIEGNNYFKLRDLAFALNGSAKQFSVEYDNITKMIALESGKAYTAVGGELTKGAGKTQSVSATQSKITLDGKEVTLVAYNIGGNNYFKLRDIAKLLDFGVGYDSATKTITVDTAAGYTE